MSVNTKMTALAEAIRAKTGKTAPLTLDQMVTEIEGITGGTEMFAAIGVTYPAGSVLTCTNGTKTLTAKTTSGQWVFAIPETGTWTVTSTANDGSGNSKSKTVEITSEGQLESVTLIYQLVLFDSGVVVPWKVIGANPTATITDTIYLSASNPTTAVVSSVRTTDKIDVSGYSTLKYTVTENKNPANAFMCVTSSTSAPINAGITNTVTSKVVAYGQPRATGTYSVDVSDVQGEHYVSIAEGHYSGSGLRVSKVWLE